MWFQKSVLYHIYPMGFCGVLERQDNGSENRLAKIADWIPHLKELSVDALYFGPLFDSDRHGYDTRDYTKIDARLGSNDDFAAVCETLHEEGFKIILDGVFNHVGRGFWAFQDVLQHREQSPYRHWFHIDFSGNSNYNDGLWYEGWEGHYELVRLNLHNPELVEYLLSCVRGWMDAFDIDGIRLDVAYMLDRNFMLQLAQFTRSIKPDFFLLGEMIHGDYNQLLEAGMLSSCTNYECYKGLYSSFNSMNMFEIGFSLNRQFGPEQWTLYRGKHLTNFVDNHDVNRIASTLTNPAHLPLVYGMLFAMPGIPCLYYGSEWGAEGARRPHNDDALRPCFEAPVSNALTRKIAGFAKQHRLQEALQYGGYEQIALTNEQIVFLREYGDTRIFIAINASERSATLHAQKLYMKAEDLLTGDSKTFEGEMELPGLSVSYWKEVK